MAAQAPASSPVPPPAGAAPSVCSAYWNSPSAGTLYADITGPAVLDADGTFPGSGDSPLAAIYAAVQRLNERTGAVVVRLE